MADVRAMSVARINFIFLINYIILIKYKTNFFINHGKATATDISTLIQIARKEVKEKFNIMLELEIKTFGFDENELLPNG